MRSDPGGSTTKPGPTRPFGAKPCVAGVVCAGELKAGMTIDHPDERDPALLRIGVEDRRALRGREAMALRTAWAPCRASAGPFLALGPPWPSTRGRCSSIVNRVVRSTRVPIAELPGPRIRSLPAVRTGGPATTLTRAPAASGHTSDIA
jgi:hypothetical protein